MNEINAWGIEGYYVPNNDFHFHKPRTFWSKQRKDNAIDVEAKKKKNQPRPNSYKLGTDFGKLPNGKFLNGSRRTEIDKILA